VLGVVVELELAEGWCMTQVPGWFGQGRGGKGRAGARRNERGLLPNFTIFLVFAHPPPNGRRDEMYAVTSPSQPQKQ